jgi:hypothetical protein
MLAIRPWMASESLGAAGGGGGASTFPDDGLSPCQSRAQCSRIKGHERGAADLEDQTTLDTFDVLVRHFVVT